MTPDFSLEAEQAVLGALFVDPDAFNAVADLFRPEVFSRPDHAAIAEAILSLCADRLPADHVLVNERLEAKGLLGSIVAPDLAFSLARGLGSAANVRHYVEVLEGLWAKREARRIAGEMLRSDVDEGGEEFVSRFAQRLSRIETRSARKPLRLADAMFARLERRNEIQSDPTKLFASFWPTGYGLLDGLIGGLRAGELVTIAARPGVGKSAFVAGMVESLASRRVPTAIFQLEDYAAAFADRTLMRAGRIPSTMMRDSARWTPAIWDRASRAVNERADWPVFIDDQHGQTIHELTGGMRRLAREHAVRVFVLDNLAEVLIDRQDRGEERLDRALGRIAKNYRDAAGAVGAAAVLVVHLNREVEKTNRRARLSDLKNSGEIEDASHVVVVLNRDPGSTDLVVDVVKNRNGPPGEARLHWDGEFMAVRNAKEG